MRIALITPGLDKLVDDIFYAFHELAKLDHDILVLGAKHKMSQKGEINEQIEYEKNGRLSIYRIYESFSDMYKKSKKKEHYNVIYKLLKEFKPEIIFCCHELNIELALLIKKDFNIPIVTLVEHSKNSSYPFFEKLKAVTRKLINDEKIINEYIFLPLNHIYWKYMLRKSDAIITHSPLDKDKLKSLSRFGTPVYYVQWCNQMPDFTRKDKIAGRGIYIGSLSKFKNSWEFSTTLPMLLKQDFIEEFFIIGPTFDNTDRLIKKLKIDFPKKIKWLRQLPRNEALSLLSSSFFAYTPAKRCGWGLIGDSWGTKTPLVVTHNDYRFTNGKDALLVPDIKKISQEIKKLYENPDLYKSIVSGGFERYSDHHTAKYAASKYDDIIKKTYGK